MATVSTAPARRNVATRVPPEALLIGSAVFHYLGPSFAVLLFAYVDVLGVAWLRIVSAAVVFAVWRRPWQAWRTIDAHGRRGILAWGVVLALMNCAFYMAIARLPLATVAGVEFLPVIALAALGSRTWRNLAALVLAVAGVYLLTGVVLTGEPLGVAFAFANAALFAAYIVVGHKVASHGARAGIDSLALAMLVASIVVTPLAGGSAAPALAHPATLLAGIGVGVTSSVVPYVLDQVAMARVKRSTYALLISLLPATATVVGLLVLGQVPTSVEAAGVGLVVVAVGLHRDAEAA
jgi:inner membrane transporter RhtA